jgi:hypothetical protein
MSTKPREHRRVEPHAMSATQAEAAETKVADSARHQKIRLRAYEVYLERGEQPGHDLDDWLQAERELTTNHTGE